MRWNSNHTEKIVRWIDAFEPQERIHSGPTTVVNFRCRIEIEDLMEELGESFFSGVEGLLIAPFRLEEPVIVKARQKMRSQKVVRKAVEIDMRLTGTAAWKKTQQAINN